MLVACSGGPDSGALLDVLARLAGELGIELCAASVDHGLRAEAARDVEIAASLAQKLDVPFRALRVQVPPGASVQALARAARYQALLKLARELGARRIATGHTLDDQAETVLSRILRGAGVVGLGGVAPKRRDGVVRPLIDVRRSDARAWADLQGLPFVDDSSNADPRYLRVRVRRTLLPALAAEDPAIVTHLAALADDARAEARLVHGAAARLLARARTEDGLALVLLAAAPAAARSRALALWLREATGRVPRRAHLDAIERSLTGSARIPLGRGLFAVLGDGLAKVVGTAP